MAHLTAAHTTALLLADGRLPVGGYTQSGGLEPGLAAGMPASAIPDYLLTRLETVCRVEAAAAVLARRWVTLEGRTQGPAAKGAAGRADDEWPGPGLVELQVELAARMPSAPLREASAQLGRGLLRLAERLWPAAPPVTALASISLPLRPIALGVVGGLAGLDDTATARASVYDDIQTVATAAPKLIGLDPLNPVEWVLALAPIIETVVAEAVTVTSAADLPAYSAPQTEQWSLDHHHRPRRIFRA